MPALAFLAVVGLVLVALLYLANATLEPGAPPIVVSQRSGLPAPWHPDAIKTLTATSAPAPDMSSQAVLAAQPKSAPDEAVAKIGSEARAARAEAPLKNKRITQPIDRRATQPTGYQQTPLFDRFSIKGY